MRGQIRWIDDLIPILGWILSNDYVRTTDTPVFAPEYGLLSTMYQLDRQEL